MSSFFCPLSFLRARVRPKVWATAFVIASFAVVPGRADYQGPVPAPTDAFGGPGAYAVVRETFPSPDWPDQVVTVFRPAGVEGKRPTWFFAHGFGATQPEFYLELLMHLASHGDVVIYSPYAIALPRAAAGLYATMWDGFAAAVQRYPERIDTTRVGFAGHSYGGGAVPWLALKAVRERGWGSNGLALLLLAPWYSYFTSDADLAAFPPQTQAVVQIYEDDLINDHRMAIDVFTRLNVTPENKDFLTVHSDRIDSYNYVASHRVPTGGERPEAGFTPTAFDAFDRWGVARIATALGASAWRADPAGRSIALGHGAEVQTQMGATAGGRALRPMTETTTPVPLFPESRYKFPFHDELNPRASASLPAPVAHARLMNLSARAWSGEGEEVLIVGTSITGARPKSLLIRAVGPGLRPLGVANAMADPQLRVFRGGRPELEVDDWADAPSPDVIGLAGMETGAFPLGAGSKDAALLASFSAGQLTAHAIPRPGNPGVALLELYDADLDASSRLENLSARARVSGGEDVLIAGFVIDGGDARVLVRGLGPALASLGVASALPDPELEIYRGNERIAANDNWSAATAEADAIANASAQVGAFALAPHSTDASVLVTLPPGVYSAHVRPHDGRNGVGLVEVYVLP